MATQLLQANDIDVNTVPHSDTTAIEEKLAEIKADTRVWLLIDGVYSMYGDVAPGDEVRGLLDRYPNLHVYCDDAHGFGWDGRHGRGNFLRKSGWHERLVVVAGLSKSFGATGGVIATVNSEWAEMIELVGPPLTFGGPIPPAALGAGVASTEIHLSEELDELQSDLEERIRVVNAFSTEIGLPLARTDESPIWFLDVGDFDSMASLLVKMTEAGFYLNASTFPIVPQGHAGLRFTVTNYNSMDQIEAMLLALNDARLELFGETQIEIGVDQTEQTVK